MRKVLEIPDALVTTDERKLLLDRRQFDRDDSVWSDAKRHSRQAIIEENYWATGSDLNLTNGSN